MVSAWAPGAGTTTSQELAKTFSILDTTTALLHTHKTHLSFQLASSCCSSAGGVGAIGDDNLSSRRLRTSSRSSASGEGGTSTFAEEELPPPPPCSILALPPPPPPALLLLPPPAPSAQGEQHVEAADMLALAAPCSEQHAVGVVPAGADAERTAAAAC